MHISTALLPLALIAALVANGAAAEATAISPVEKSTVSLPAITVSKVTRLPMNDVVAASGLIGAVEQVLVQPQIEGQAIDAIEVEIGDTVAAGQVLARLSDTSLTLQKSQLLASLASANATIAQAEAQLIEAKTAADEAVRVKNRTLALTAAGTTSKSAADTATANATSTLARVTVATQGLVAAQAQLTLVDAQVANIDLSLKRTLVTAPVAGEVVERNAMVGAIASGGGQPMFMIVRDGLLELRADVAEQDILKLQAGQKASLSVVGLAETLTGTVWLVEPTVDATTRLGRVRISIDESDRVRSGMFADARILVQSREALAVPVSAVGGSGSETRALKVSGDTVKATMITTGIRDGGLIEVMSGLAEGDLIVTKAGAFVRDGDHINPIMADAAKMSN